MSLTINSSDDTNSIQNQKMKDKADIAMQAMNDWFTEMTPVQEPEKIIQMVHEQLKQYPEWDEPFLVSNLQDVVHKFRIWQQHLPGLEMFYATKANDDQYLLKILAALGASFDCASQGEVEKVLSLGVSPDKVMYSNPYKMESHLRKAAAWGVRWMVCDSPDELRKIATHCPQAKLVIRILPRKESTDYLLMSAKFGCRTEEALALAVQAKELGLQVHGISFYVGHCTNSGSPYTDAISVAREVIDEAKALGHPVHLLDIGGGFQGPAEKRNLFVQVCSSIRSALTEHFGYGNQDQTTPRFRFVGEPGQFIGIESVNVYAKVIGVRRRVGQPPESETHQAVYLSSGHFGCIPCHNFKYNRTKMYLLQDPEILSSRPLMRAAFWGPTCDPMDSLVTLDSFPTLERGDWLRLDNMGAYTRQMGTRYNGFQLPQVKYFITPEVRSLLASSLVNGVNGVHEVRDQKQGTITNGHDVS